MMSSLGSLAQATDKNVAAIDALQRGVQRDTGVVQDLLVKGKAAQKVKANNDDTNEKKKKNLICPYWVNQHIMATIH